MQITLWKWIIFIVIIVIIAIIVIFNLHKLPENDRVAGLQIMPTSIIDGLAVYKIGEGEPVLLFPYPHGSTTSNMAESQIIKIFVSLGRSVITFDPPQAYYSSRSANFSLKEMIECANEALQHFNIKETVDVAGHSMGGFCSLAFTVEHPSIVKRLIVITGNTGFPSTKEQWFEANKTIPGSDMFKMTYYGFRQIIGTGNLSIHKKLNNLEDYYLFVNKEYFVPEIIESDDWRRPSPPRANWMNAIKKEDYSDRINEIKVPVLLISGRNDIFSSEKQNNLIHEKIYGSRLIFFEKSMHYPFIEEEEKFIETIQSFLADNG